MYEPRGFSVGGGGGWREGGSSKIGAQRPYFLDFSWSTSIGVVTKSFGGEAGAFGGEASPPPPLDRTLIMYSYGKHPFMSTSLVLLLQVAAIQLFCSRVQVKLTWLSGIIHYSYAAGTCFDLTIKMQISQ